MVYVFSWTNNSVILHGSIFFTPGISFVVFFPFFNDYFSVSLNKELIFTFYRGTFVPLSHFVHLNFDAPSALRINRYHKILKILFYVTLIS